MGLSSTGDLWGGPAQDRGYGQSVNSE